MVWSLTPKAFEQLLAALDGDRERAATVYEGLRHRTIGLLRWWGAAQPEELADDTLDRVARKLEQGAQIESGSLGAYVRGVARLVFYESTREPVVVPIDHEPAVPVSSDAAEAAGKCLDQCLGALAHDDRSLLLRYYDGGKAADVRRRLARELGLSATALRIRAHRLRLQIEACVTACLAVNGRTETFRAS